MWGVKEEEAAVAPPVVRIAMRTAEEEQAEAQAKAEAERQSAENKKILRPTKPEKSIVQKRAASKAKAANDESKPVRRTVRRAKAAAAAE